jgi:hypothetical protein
VTQDRDGLSKALVSIQEGYQRTVRQLESKVEDLHRQLAESKVSGRAEDSKTYASKSVFTTSSSNKYVTSLPLLSELRAIRGVAVAATEREQALSNDARSLLSVVDDERMVNARLLREATAEKQELLQLLHEREEEIEKLDQIAEAHQQRI